MCTEDTDFMAQITHLTFSRYMMPPISIHQVTMEDITCVLVVLSQECMLMNCDNIYQILLLNRTINILILHKMSTARTAYFLHKLWIHRNFTVHFFQFLIQLNAFLHLKSKCWLTNYYLNRKNISMLITSVPWSFMNVFHSNPKNFL